MKVGEKIRSLREERRLSQDELARAVGYKTRSSIAKIESGDNDPPQKMLLKLAHALDVSPADLLDESISADDVKKSDNSVTLKTKEARILAQGFDRMPEAERKRALEMVKLIFAPYADLFEQKGKLD